ncbi:hypothetical protein CBL_21224, partial [Carabus blaptoides fortunei]
RPASAADLGENSTKRQRTILNTNSSAAFTEHESKASNSPSTSIFETKTFIESQTHVPMNKGIQVKPKYRSEYTQYVCGVQDMSTSPIKSILINTITSPIKIKSSSTTVKKTLSFSSDLSSITGTSSPAVATTDLSDSLSDENSEVDKEQLTMLSVRRSLLVIKNSSRFYVGIPNECMEIIADRGFKHVEQLLISKKCKLVRPPSVYSSTKPTKKEVMESKRIASLRIHVER